MTARLSCVRLAYSESHSVETTIHNPIRQLKDFIPLLFLLLVWGYFVIPGVVLWVIAVYGALCELLWRAPSVVFCGVVRLWRRVRVGVPGRTRI